jgi:hypothetical protein
LKSGSIDLDAFSIGCDCDLGDGDRRPGLNSDPGLHADPGMNAVPGLKSGAIDLDAFGIG